MATFSYEKAKIQEVYIRMPQQGGTDKYIRQPFNLVRYDDNSGEYIEPISLVGTSNYTWHDLNTPAVDGEWLIVDQLPWDGITEIR